MQLTPWPWTPQLVESVSFPVLAAGETAGATVSVTAGATVATWQNKCKSTCQHKIPNLLMKDVHFRWFTHWLVAIDQYSNPPVPINLKNDILSTSSEELRKIQQPAWTALRVLCATSLRPRVPFCRSQKWERIYTNTCIYVYSMFLGLCSFDLMCRSQWQTALKVLLRNPLHPHHSSAWSKFYRKAATVTRIVLSISKIRASRKSWK